MGARSVQADPLSAKESEWSTALRRNEVLAPLARLDVVSHALADEAANQLSISQRHVYRLIDKIREGEGLVSDLLPSSPGTLVGTQLVSPRVGAVIDRLIETRFLTQQCRTVAALHREVAQECRALELSPPSRGTVQRRVGQLDPAVLASRRKGPDAARRLAPVTGRKVAAEGPLSRVQMDHTPIDVIVVDEVTRRDIGRAYLTIAMDIYSRCILGSLVSFDAPSSISVGLCLTDVVTDKSALIESLGESVSWPMAGKPRILHVDNAREFHARALERGCEQHGIVIEYGRPGMPQDRGHIERAIGTFMKMVHELPGTTFSNIAERNRYDSQGRAVLTIRELQRWLVLAIARYHGTIQSSLGRTPQSMWSLGLERFGSSRPVTDGASFLLDFLPVEHRKITREGIQWDYVHYYSSALNPWISRRDSLPRFMVRRDPRDISRIWVLDPRTKELLEVPATTMLESRTIWEHRAALSHLKREGRLSVNEVELDRITDRMRRVEAEAAAITKRVRREASASASRPARPQLRGVPVPPTDPTEIATVVPFEELEQW